MSNKIDDTVVAAHAPWWKGARGEWYVVAQIVLFAIVIFGPRTWVDGPLVSLPNPRAWSVGAIVLFAGGAMLLGAGGRWLGPPNLTALPRPREEGTLVTTGPFALVRHPIYSGGWFMALGWAIWVRGPLTLVYVLALLVFIDVKAREEERWLCEKFAGYPDYQARVRKLIPFIY